MADQLLPDVQASHRQQPRAALLKCLALERPPRREAALAVTPDQIRWLTWGAIQHRPSGAPRWDEPGTHKAITDHCGTWGLEIATDHVLAHARDPKARTPFAIKGNKPNVDIPHAPRFPPRTGEECRYHRGEYANACRACRADELAGEPPPGSWRDVAPPEVREKYLAEIRAARSAAPDHRASDAHQPTTEQGADHG
jgi:hypothetical protein